MIDCLLLDILYIIFSKLSASEFANLAFVSRSLRKSVGSVTAEDLLGHSIRDLNRHLYREYLARLRTFPRRLVVDLGRTGNPYFINLALAATFPQDVYDFWFNIARGLLLSNRHQNFANLATNLQASEIRFAIGEYLSDWKNISLSIGELGRYISFLGSEHLTIAMLANIFRAVPEFKDHLHLLPPDCGHSFKTQAALESDSLEVFLALNHTLWDGSVKELAPFASIRLAKEAAMINPNLGAFCLAVIFHRRDIDLLLENIDLLYTNSSYMKEFFTVFEYAEVERILAHERKYPGNIFGHMPRESKYFKLALDHGYTLCKLSFYLEIYDREDHTPTVMFNPPITTSNDRRLEFLNFLHDDHCRLVKFFMAYENVNRVKVNYRELASRETAKLLIKNYKLEADFCLNQNSLIETWIDVRGAKDLNIQGCSKIYYYLSSQANMKKSKRMPYCMHAIVHCVLSNKQTFIRAILQARRGTFKYSALETILTEINLDKEEKALIEEMLGTKSGVLRPYKKRKISDQ